MGLSIAQIWLLMCLCGYGSSPVAVEFQSQKACESAKVAFFRPTALFRGTPTDEDVKRSMNSYNERYNCVPKWIED